MKQSQRIAKNTLFGLLAAGLGGGLQFFGLLLVAWHLGVVDFGVFSYLLAFATIFQFVADFGLSNILIREMTRRPDEVEHLLGSAKALLWVFFGLGLILVLGVILVLPISPLMKELSWIMCLGYLCRLHVAPYSSVLRSKEHMEFNSIAFILHKVITVVLLWGVLTLKWGLLGVVWADFSANIFLWVYYSLIVSIGFSPGRLRYDLPLWKSLLAESIPMGSGLVLRQSAWQLDMFILGLLVDPFSLGLFSCPFRLLMGMSLVSGLLTQPLFPLFVRLAHQAREEFAVVYQRTIKWFCILSFPITALGLAWPEKAIGLFFGQHFLPATPALMIMSLAVFSMFVSVLFPFLFSALNRQIDFFKIMLGAVAIRILAEVWFVPRIGYLSECVIIAVVEFGLFGALAYRLTFLGLPLDIRVVMKPALAALPCLGVLVFLPHATVLGMATSLLFCLLIYPGMLWLLGALNKEELALLREGLNFIGAYRKNIQAHWLARNGPRG